MKINKSLKYIFNTFVFSAVFFLLLHNFVFAEDTATSTPDITSSTLVSINLVIESATLTLFNDEISISACAPSASSTETFNGYCAIKQSGLTNTWSSFGDAKFLDSIEGITNDYSNNLYWNWFTNLEYGQTSLNEHILGKNENLLITLGRLPLKISVSTTTPYIDATSTVSVFQFGFDDFFNGVWLPSASSSVIFAGEAREVSTDGQYNIFISTSTSFFVYAEKENFLKSNTIVLSPVVSTTTPILGIDTIASPPTSTGDSSSGGGGSSNCVFDLAKAIQFLISKQKSDGSFGSSLYTDWVVIALAKELQNESRDKLISYLKNAGNSLSSVTDYERHVMALEALGINPYTGTSINYIQKIIDQFDGTQIGDSSLVNDDIFAIFPLISAGYTVDDLIIKKIVAFIISRQDVNGSWEGSVDLTASAIQAFSSVFVLNGVTQSINQAKNFLLARQQDDGGFGSSFSTSWVLQAIASLGELGLNWKKNGNNLQDSLCSLQQSDGGLDSVTLDENSRIWATSYAVPAMLGKFWSVILPSFAKQTSVINNISSNAGGYSIVTTEATSSVYALSTTTTQLIMRETLNENIKKDFLPILQEKPALLKVEDIQPTENITKTSQLSAVAESGGQIPLAGVIITGLFGLLGVVYIFKLK